MGKEKKTKKKKKKKKKKKNKDSVTPDGRSSVSIANARRTSTKYTTRIGSTHLQSIETQLTHNFFTHRRGS